MNRKDKDKEESKGRGGKKKRVRRGKRIRNKLKSLKIYHVNIRGIKSKVSALGRILEEEKPHIVCLNETLMRPNEGVEVHKNYKFYHNSEHGDKWGWQ